MPYAIEDSNGLAGFDLLDEPQSQAGSPPLAGFDVLDDEPKGFEILEGHDGDQWNSSIGMPRPESAWTRGKRAVREALTPMIGPSEEQTLREATSIDEHGRPVYKPLGDAIEREGFARALSHPMVEIPRAGQQEGKAAQVAAAGWNTLASLAEFFESPLGVATMGLGSLPKAAMGTIEYAGAARAEEYYQAARKLNQLAAAAYSADIASHLPDQKRVLGDALEHGTLQDQVAASLDLLASAGFTVATAKHATDGFRTESPDAFAGRWMDFLTKHKGPKGVLPLRFPLKPDSAEEAPIVEPGPVLPPERPAPLAPEPEPAPPLTQDAVAELEAALRANQIKTRPKQYVEGLRPDRTEAPGTGPDREVGHGGGNVDVRPAPEPRQSAPVEAPRDVEAERPPADIVLDPLPLDVGQPEPEVLPPDRQSGRAETIIGSNERVGSEMPAEREQRLTAPTATIPPDLEAQASAPADLPKPPRPRRNRGPEPRPWDVIDEIEGNVGHISPKLIREADPHWRPIGAARRLFRANGVPADVAMIGLPGIDPDMSVGDFGELLNEAARGRKAERDRLRREREHIERESRKLSEAGKQADQFNAKAVGGERPKRDAGNVVTIPTMELWEGDTFKVQDHRFTVESVEVDEDGHITSITVKDGPKFGVQTLDPNTVQILHVDNRSWRKADRGGDKSGGAESPFSLRPDDERSNADDAWRQAVDFEHRRQEWRETRARGANNRAMVEAAAREAEARWPGAPKIVVVDTEADLPIHIIPPEGTISEGVYDTRSGQVYLVAEAIADGAAARRIIAHEVIGHGGLRAVFGERLDEFLDGVWRRYEASARWPDVVDIIRDYEGQMQDPTAPTVADRRLIAEEIVARIAEGSLENAPLLQRITDAVRAWWERITGQDPSEARIRYELRRVTSRLREDRDLRHLDSTDTLVRMSLDRGPEHLPEDSRNATPEQLDRIFSELRDLRDRQRAIRARGEQPPVDLTARLTELESFAAEVLDPARRPRRAQSQVHMEPNPDAGRRRPDGGTVPPFRGPESLPTGGGLREAFDGLTSIRSRMREWWKGRGARDKMTYLRDSAETRANLFGRRGLNLIRRQLNRQFNERASRVGLRNHLRESALTFAIEADRDPRRLVEFHQMIEASEAGRTWWGKGALRAIEYAAAHWSKYEPVVETYRRITSAQRETEVNSGVNTLEFGGGYVMHLQAGDAGEVGASSGRPTPAGQPFRHIRDYRTYAEAIEAGVRPETLNAADLLGRRLAAGQKVLTEAAWIDSLREIIDPVNKEPLVVDTKIKIRADGTQDIVAPSGYRVVRIGPAEFALQDGYVGTFNALTTPSWWRSGGIVAGVQKGFATAKHVTLLFDTFHLGRLAFWKVVLTGSPAYAKGALLLDNNIADIREMARRGEIPAEWVNDLEANRAKLQLAIKTGLNVGTVSDNIYNDWIQNLPGIGRFNRWLFGQYQRGAMAEAWLIEFERMRRRLPNQSDEVVARMVSRDINTRFGNLGSQGWIKSKTGQDLARLVFLAPQWNEGLIRSELRTVWQLGKMPFDSYAQRQLVVGTMLKATGTMILGQFIANQMLNYITRGKPTWENEEEGVGAKISAWIPDVVGNGPGFFLNPMAIAGEYAHMIERQLERSEGFADAAQRILHSRLSGPTRAALMLFTRHDELGRAVREGDMLKTMGRALVPMPIFSSTVGAAVKQAVTGEPSEKFAGQYQKQALSTFGIKADQAPNPEQRVRALAREFNHEHGIVPSGEYYAGDFYALTEALRRGNKIDAADALDELLQKKTPRQIYEHYSRWVHAPYTGQRAREQEFWRGLNASQREAYAASRQARQDLAKQASTILRRRMAAAPAK